MVLKGLKQSPGPEIHLTLIDPVFFVLEMSSAFMSAAYIQVCFTPGFIMEENTVNIGSILIAI